MSVCVCILALVSQHAMRMPRMAICALSGSTTFLYISHKRHDIKNNIEHEMGVHIFSTNLSEAYPLPRRIFRLSLDIIINVCRSSCKVPVIIVRFRRNSNFLERF
jgi:hypothetical protein